MVYKVINIVRYAKCIANSKCQGGVVLKSTHQPPRAAAMTYIAHRRDGANYWGDFVRRSAILFLVFVSTEAAFMLPSNLCHVSDQTVVSGAIKLFFIPVNLSGRSGKVLLALTSTVIHGSGFRGTHGHIFMSYDPGTTGF
jgi:hypothetical protein